jgi:DNA repair exonuclease SbcCD nuclease subunit
MFADLHLGTIFNWAKPEVARARRSNLRETLDRIIKTAHEERVDALMCGGDLYEAERLTPDTIELLRTQFAHCDMPVLLAPGNHDWYGPASAYARASWTDNVIVFSEPRFRRVELEDGLSVWGAAHTRPAGTRSFFEDGFRVTSDDLHVALFHGAEAGLLFDEAEGKAVHAEFRKEQIPEAGFAYAFAGHYHTPRDVEHLSYPGNPDPLSFGEDHRGGLIIAEVDSSGSVEIQRRDVSTSVVHDLTLDVTGCASFQEVRARAIGLLAEKHGVVRLAVTGELNPHVDLDLADLEATPCDLDQVVVTRGKLSLAYDIDALAQDPTVRGEFVRLVLGAADRDEDERRRILHAGLRALDGEDPLEGV